MSKNPEELRIRMSYRRKTKEDLEKIVNGDFTDLEKSIASEMLSKMEKGQSQTEAQPTPVKTQVPPKKKLLSDEEEVRLAEAEEEFDKRQKARKTVSKTDKTMKTSDNQNKSVRETKRQNIDASDEVPGIKVGSEVRVKGGDEVGKVVRLYISSDGKEKSMVDFSGKTLKKRVSTLELVK